MIDATQRSSAVDLRLGKTAAAQRKNSFLAQVEVAVPVVNRRRSFVAWNGVRKSEFGRRHAPPLHE